jgi:hypothetical protein
MDKATVLSESDILNIVQVVFNPPVVSLECDQAVSICDLWCKADDAVADFPLGGVLLTPGAFPAQDLGQSRPITIARQVSGGYQTAGFVMTTMNYQPYKPHGGRSAVE